MQLLRINTLPETPLETESVISIFNSSEEDSEEEYGTNW